MFNGDKKLITISMHTIKQLLVINWERFPFNHSNSQGPRSSLIWYDCIPVVPFYWWCLCCQTAKTPNAHKLDQTWFSRELYRPNRTLQKCRCWFLVSKSPQNDTPNYLLQLKSITTNQAEDNLFSQYSKDEWGLLLRFWLLVSLPVPHMTACE